MGIQSVLGVGIGISDGVAVATDGRALARNIKFQNREYLTELGKHFQVQMFDLLILVSIQNSVIFQK
ncbi:hypothetical protein LZ554_002971 [Drepanopeziza brunnea f. sp. 'monogermtubi']|nr:hypothetical protein LZ554_002971 [Drepanopeziza brunnea f. sp. 'monogermtubi']